MRCISSGVKTNWISSCFKVLSTHTGVCCLLLWNDPIIWENRPYKWYTETQTVHYWLKLSLLSLSSHSNLYKNNELKQNKWNGKLQYAKKNNDEKTTRSFFFSVFTTNLTHCCAFFFFLCHPPTFSYRDFAFLTNSQLFAMFIFLQVCFWPPETQTGHTEKPKYLE